MDNTYLIYKHTSPSGKSYIGQTNNIARRNNSHQSSPHCTAFSLAIKKYGWNSFNHEILIDNLSGEDANDWEKFYIFIENTISPSGYNLQFGGDNHKCSEETRLRIKAAKQNITAETRAKIGAYHIGNTYCLGRVMSDATREKLRIANIGKTLSEETKKKISIAGKGRKYPIRSHEWRKKLSESNKGFKHTESAKIKMSLSRKGVPKSLAHIEKMRLAMIGNTHAVGRKHTEEEKAKIGRASKGNTNWLNKEHSEKTKIKMANTARNRPSTSEHKGVNWNKKGSKWQVEIKVYGKRIYIGMFINIDDAISARKEAELKYWV